MVSVKIPLFYYWFHMLLAQWKTKQLLTSIICFNTVEYIDMCTTGYLQTLTSFSAWVSIRGVLSPVQRITPTGDGIVRLDWTWFTKACRVLCVVSYKLGWTEALSSHMLPKPLVWQRRSLSYWQSVPQSPIERLFNGCVQRRVKEFKFYFISPTTHTPPHQQHLTAQREVLICNDQLRKERERCVGFLLCENLLSSATAAIFFSQLVTISLIANAAQCCHQALVQSCHFPVTHAPLPVLKYFTRTVHVFYLEFKCRL